MNDGTNAEHLKAYQENETKVIGEINTDEIWIYGNAVCINV